MLGGSDEQAARRPAGRSIPPAVGSDHRPSPSVGPARTGPGQPPLPARLVAGLFILKPMPNLSGGELCERWVENPYEVVFQHACPFDRWDPNAGSTNAPLCRLKPIKIAPRNG